MTVLFFNIVKISTIEIFYLTGIIIIIGFLLGILEKITNKNMQKSFGYKGILTTAIIGTPVHEIGHAIMCVIFLHRINKIKLLQFHSTDGTLGYVEHSYNKKNIYQRIGNFFIGVGPILSGTFVLLLSLYFLLPSSFTAFNSSLKQNLNYTTIDFGLIKYIFFNSLYLIKYIFSITNLIRINFWIFVIIAFSVSSHIALSKPDIKGALDGFLMLYIIIIFLNALAQNFSVNTFDYILRITKYNAYFSSLLFLALLFSVISFFISQVIYFIKK